MIEYGYNSNFRIHDGVISNYGGAIIVRKAIKSIGLVSIGELGYLLILSVAGFRSIRGLG